MRPLFSIMPRGYPANGTKDIYKAAKNLANGTPQGQLVKGWFALQPELFTAIRNRARRKNTSFSHQLRVLLQRGLDCDVN